MRSRESAEGREAMNIKDVRQLGARLANSRKAEARESMPTAIRELAALLTETGLTEIEIEQGGMRLRVARQSSTAAISAAPVAVPLSEPVAAPAGRPAARRAAKAPAHWRSDLADGRHGLYLAAAGRRAFVKVGDSVQAKATRC